MVLVGYWPLNETEGDTAYDYSGNENHTGNFPSDGVSIGEDGLASHNSYYFDGVSGSTLRYNYPATKSFTATFWAKSVGLWNDRGLWSDRGANGFLFHPNNGEKSLRFYVLENEFNNYHVIGTYTPKDITKWNMYTITHENSTGTSKVYVNSNLVLKDSTTTNRTLTSNSANVADEDEDFSSGDNNEAYICQLRYYNRPLPQREIQYLYSVSRRGSFTSRKKSL